MSVSSITSAFANYAQQVTGGSSGQSTASNALAEAKETKAQTAKEARNGDRVAIAKLRRDEAQQQSEAATSESGKGEQVDQKA